jgi:hypothetical protein
VNGAFSVNAFSKGRTNKHLSVIGVVIMLFSPVNRSTPSLPMERRYKSYDNYSQHSQYYQASEYEKRWKKIWFGELRLL